MFDFRLSVDCWVTLQLLKWFNKVYSGLEGVSCKIQVKNILFFQATFFDYWVMNLMLVKEIFHFVLTDFIIELLDENFKI